VPASLDDRTAAPPAFLRLAGHPLRWRLLRELARSDRTVRELTGLVAQPQNLVSYHLGKLRGADLVAARRSTADRRDAYYRVDLARVGDLLAASGAALHPGLRLAAPPVDRGAVGARARVLFLCTGNSGRSQMAEALLRARSGGLVEACSAGSHPKPVHADAVRVMRERYGIDLSAQRSKHLRVFADDALDHVVSLCDRVREVCPDFPGRPETAHWSIPDPAAGGGDGEGGGGAGYAAFEETAAELDVRVGFLLSALTTADDRS
jgi:ArsR family transcriptional regulator, arsenate/arsenite/antimonite-responsive transcriptional repressor / arsenate reductase (thioredoxin)